MPSFKTDSLILNNQDFTATGNALYLNGQTPLMPISGNAPALNSLNIPISINVYGSITNLMGTPIHFIDCAISGVTRKIPCY